MDNELETAAYYIPSSVKDRIEQEAKKQDLNASQFVRRILADYFARLDTERALTEADKPAKKRVPIPA